MKKIKYAIFKNRDELLQFNKKLCQERLFKNVSQNLQPLVEVACEKYTQFGMLHLLIQCA